MTTLCWVIIATTASIAANGVLCVRIKSSAGSFGFLNRRVSVLYPALGLLLYSCSRRRQRRAPFRLIVLRRFAEDAAERGGERARAGVAQRVGNRADAVAVGQPAEGVGQMHLLPPLAVVQAGLLRE